MPSRHSVSANGSLFSAHAGETLLDAALLGGVEFPHDCRTGRCGTCLVRVREGTTLGGESGQPAMVLACQARVLSNLKVEYDVLPPVARVAGRLDSLIDLSGDVVELSIRPSAPLAMLPGQYCRVAFQGHPARAYSPTAPVGRAAQSDTISLHVQRVPGGRVSSRLGQAISAGHRLTIEGPFGTAFHRPNRNERLVLASRGTGFAPIFAVANAALRENWQREMVLVAGARTLEALYMPAALGRLSAAPNVAVIATVEEPQIHSRLVRHGPVPDNLPPLDGGDIVYVAGGYRLVETIVRAALDAGAGVYYDKFDTAEAANATGQPRSLWSKAATWLN